jgi:hypothetical protein
MTTKTLFAFVFALALLAATPALAMDSSHDGHGDHGANMEMDHSEHGASMDHGEHGDAASLKETLKGADLDEAYEAADENGDGVMDMMEFHKTYPQFSHEEFMAMDQDGDYELSKSEWTEAMSE